jgi:hypothetical protein
MITFPRWQIEVSAADLPPATAVSQREGNQENVLRNILKSEYLGEHRYLPL